MWNKYQTCKDVINKNRNRLTAGEFNKFKNIKASFRNIAEDGFVGGESGVSDNHINKSMEWLRSIVDKYQLMTYKLKRYNYNQPILVDTKHNTYGPMDKLPDGREAGIEYITLMLQSSRLSASKVMRAADAPSLHDYLAGRSNTITFDTYRRVIETITLLSQQKVKS